MGDEHYDVARQVQEILQRYKDLQDIIAISGHGRALRRRQADGHPRRKVQRFLSQPFHVAEVFTGSPGVYVELKDTIEGFKAIVDGKHDDLPEQAFYMVGTMESAIEKGRRLAAE